MDWQALRADFPALGNHTYLNTAGIGLTPQPVTAEIQRFFGAWSAQGATTPTFREEVGRLEGEARQRAARLFRALPEELAFTGRVAESLHIVVDGLRWRPGDEIITGDEEVLYAPLYRLAQEQGVVVRILHMAYEWDELLSRFAALLGPRTRFVWLSDTSNKSGLHLPARAICDLAHARGALVMLDGAQTAGQYPMDLRALGCDLYAITGYKWLLGPYGCGLLYVRRDLIPELRALRLGRGTLDHARCAYVEDDTAQRFEFGVRNVILRLGFGAALNYLRRIGLEAIHARTMALRDHLRRRLAEVPRARVLGPSDPALQSGITSVMLEGVEPEAIVQAAWEANIVIVSTELPSTRPDLRAVRISPAFYNTEDELDRVAEVLEGIR